MSLIQCNNVVKQYGEKTVLHGLSFELDSGAPIALVGPNGAGKTTLFSILCGYISPSKGNVSILGEAPGSAALFSQVSALPQDAQLDPRFSIRRQLTLFAQLQGMSKKEAKKEAERVLSLMQLSDAVRQKPAALSHGMRKRVAIAQALIGKPALVLLDEPTAGLDPVNARNIRDIVQELASETTFIISSHNLAELEQLCDTVLHLNNGHLAQQVDLSSNNNPESQHAFLTVHMDNCPEDAFIQAIQQLDGVSTVSPSQRNQYVIDYNPKSAPELDIQLLQCINAKQWDYRQLIKGKTLEEKLFSS